MGEEILTVKSAVHHIAEGLGLESNPNAVIGAGQTDDPFHDHLLAAIGIVFVVLAIAILAFTGLIHWGAMYQTPPWNSYAYPPPIVH